MNIQALVDFAIRADRDYMECDKMYIHTGSLRQETGYNKYLVHAGYKPLTFEQWILKEATNE